MALTNLKDVMEAIAALLNGVNADYRATPYPPDSITAPATVVGYPTMIEFDSTMVRGADRALIPVYFLTGTTSDRAAMDLITAIIAGAGAIKDTLDGNLSGTVDSARVVDARVQRTDIGGALYIGPVFTVEVIA